MPEKLSLDKTPEQRQLELFSFSLTNSIEFCADENDHQYFYRLQVAKGERDVNVSVCHFEFHSRINFHRDED